MKRLTAIIYPGESNRWLVAFNPETGTTSQGRTGESALENLKAAVELALEFNFPMTKLSPAVIFPI